MLVREVRRAYPQAWAAFIEKFNGISFPRDKLLLEADLQVSLDAAGALNFSFVFQRLLVCTKVAHGLDWEEFHKGWSKKQIFQTSWLLSRMEVLDFSFP